MKNLTHKTALNYPFRTRYLDWFEPATFTDQNTKEQTSLYQAIFMIPKNTNEGIKTYNELIQVAQQLTTQKFGYDLSATLFRDGDHPEVFGKNPEYAGHWILKMSSKTRPTTVGPSLSPLTDASQFKPGYHGKAMFTLSTYDVRGQKGVKAYLSGLQMCFEDEAFSGGPSLQEAQSVFGTYGGTQPAQNNPFAQPAGSYQYQQQAQQQPQQQGGYVPF